MIEVDVMQDASEIVHYDDPEIPIYIHTGRLSMYPNMKALCHWHEELEFICVLEGEMLFDVNGENVLLHPDDCIIVNSRQMHFGHSNFRRDGHFICILLHPNLLSGNQKLYSAYVAPLIENTNIKYLYYTPGSINHQEVINFMKSLLDLQQHRPAAYELEVQGLFGKLWKHLYQQCMPLMNSKPLPIDSDLLCQKKMVSYLYQHYTEPVTLEMIAASANISRSKCCSIFRHYLQQSPIDFLNSYRLEVSCNLLKNTALPISQIALACGFNHLSYFSKIFLRKYGCTPTAYRTSAS